MKKEKDKTPHLVSNPWLFLSGHGPQKSELLIPLSSVNPVGKIYTKEELQKIGDLCVKNEIIILSDEVYERLCYKPFVRISTLSPEIERLTIIVGSASKHFYVPGWRVGTYSYYLLSFPSSFRVTLSIPFSWN